MSAAFDTLVVGAVFELSTEPVTTQQLVRYAGASGDFNRIHYDQAFAVEAGLGGVIAHGLLTMGFMARAASQWAGLRGQVQRIAARFTAPVRPGDVVQVTLTVDAVNRGEQAVEIMCTLKATVAERTVAVGEATLQLPLD